MQSHPCSPNLASAAQEKGQVLQLLREVIDAPRPELRQEELLVVARHRLNLALQCSRGWRRLPRRLARLAQLVLCLVVVLALCSARV